jgi:hypothetical protein
MVPRTRGGGLVKIRAFTESGIYDQQSTANLDTDDRDL